MVDLSVNDTPKMIRETLCVAQSGIDPATPRAREHLDRLQRLIDECDRHRPIGPDGKHGNLHTETCGCEDKQGWAINKMIEIDISVPEDKIILTNEGNVLGIINIKVL